MRMVSMIKIMKIFKIMTTLIMMTIMAMKMIMWVTMMMIMWVMMITVDEIGTQEPTGLRLPRIVVETISQRAKGKFVGRLIRLLD